MDIPILFEDDSILVINKPPGVVVNRAESVKGETVHDWVLLRDSFVGVAGKATEGVDDFYSRAGIVHRIDKETSGILLIAKTPETFLELQRQFKERIVEKSYLALVHGIVVPPKGEINAPVGRLPWNRERFGVIPEGRESKTDYSVLSTGKRGKDTYSLVAFFPHTGRTHQIRVHSKYINHAIVGDQLYAGRKTSRDDRKWAPRVMLHAWKIVLTHPENNDRISFTAPVPEDFLQSLSLAGIALPES